MKERFLWFTMSMFICVSMCFAGWQIEIVGGCSSTAWGAAIGDGDNDAGNELYAACGDGYIYQYKWNGTLWEQTDLGSAGAHWMIDADVGDGNADGTNEVYGSNFAFHTYQYVWNGTSWDRTDLGGGGRVQVDIGDGDNDGSPEVYAVCADSVVHCYKWNGTSWIESQLDPAHSGVHMLGILVGDGDNDGENEVYAISDSGLYQFEWNGTSWTHSFVDSIIKIAMKSLAIGDGNNDGEDEIYAVGDGSDSTLYQFKWNGGFWDKTPIDTLRGIRGIAVGDGNRDGENEVYTGICQGSTAEIGKIYQYKWDGVSWNLTDMGQAVCASVNEIFVGDGDNDGNLELYSNVASGIYQYVFRSVPLLYWTGDPGFETDGVNPDTGVSGDTFEFRVAYADSNNFGPLTKELQVDLNDNGTYEAWEKFSMAEMDTTDTVFVDGKNYSESLVIDYAGDGVLNYKFVFRNFYDWAIGDPINEHSVVILPSGIEERQALGQKLSLCINPNPFRNRTEITFSIGHGAEDGELKIYSATGRLIKSFNLASGFLLPASAVSWDGTDDSGRRLSAGVYFVRLETGDTNKVEKVILLR